jgi:hypothetical protein
MEGEFGRATKLYLSQTLMLKCIAQRSLLVVVVYMHFSATTTATIEKQPCGARLISQRPQ